MNEHIRTIEISGHKFEVDMRSARKIDSFRVGDRVKLLVKNYSGYSTHPGAIVGVDNFQALPTIVIAYLENEWGSSGDVKFAYINSESKDLEIAPMCEDDIQPTKQIIENYFSRAEKKLGLELSQLQERKEYFLRKYGSTFGVSLKEEAKEQP